MQTLFLNRSIYLPNYRLACLLYPSAFVFHPFSFPSSLSSPSTTTSIERTSSITSR
ncbi:Protein of unknown function [Pyronema omphalodes CBS 100304]|uniref:Uncharacterized protein n=1 Tax=Pyronema omphalodes (strain CBS 100304) TaxID=1076935 RepID=U4KZI4_PYROM|nr:Protein of unknown function [Pyronema omphalodes CBS 100304]